MSEVLIEGHRLVLRIPFPIFGEDVSRKWLGSPLYARHPLAVRNGMPDNLTIVGTRWLSHTQERERQREIERDRERETVCMCGRERQMNSVCVCVCVCVCV